MPVRSKTPCMLEFLVGIFPIALGFGGVVAAVKILERCDPSAIPRHRAWLQSAPSLLVYVAYVVFWLPFGLLMTLGSWLVAHFFGGPFDVTQWIVQMFLLSIMWAWIFNSNRKSAKLDDWLDWNLEQPQ